MCPEHGAVRVMMDNLRCPIHRRASRLRYAHSPKGSEDRGRYNTRRWRRRLNDGIARKAEQIRHLEALLEVQRGVC